MTNNVLIVVILIPKTSAKRHGQNDTFAGLFARLHGRGHACHSYAMETALDTFFRYFPVSPMDEDWGLYVTTAGYVKIAPGAAYPPPGHPKGYAFFWQTGRILHEFQLHYISCGGGVFESKTGGRKQIEAGSIFLLFPGEWHRYTARGTTGWHEYWVGFDGQYARRLLRKGFLSLRTPVLKPREEHSLLDLFTGMVGEMRAERIGFSQILGATTVLMLAIVHAAARARGSIDTHAETVIRQAKSLLYERLDQPIELERVADKLHVGYAWLRRNFLHHTGLALHQYHLQLRINRAMHLLSGTTVTIKEVAAQSGFDDALYFSRLFKKKTGRNPESWRRLYLAQKRG